MNAPAETLPDENEFPRDGVTVATLVKWRNRVHEAVGKIGRSRVSYVMPKLGTGSPGDRMLFEAQESLQTVNAALFEATARQGFTETPKETPDLDLSALATVAALDSPDARELLHVLEMAQEIAERVDAQRGRALPGDIPLQPGESRGGDLAEEISYLCLRLRGEVSPPKGRGE